MGEMESRGVAGGEMEKSEGERERESEREAKCEREIEEESFRCGK